MAGIEKFSMRLFAGAVDEIIVFFPDLKSQLNIARFKISAQEFIAKGMLFSLLSFILTVPMLSLILSLFLGTFLFSFMTAFTFSIAIGIAVFVLYINYPKSIISQKRKDIDKSLPFLVLNLSSIAGSKLNLTQIFKIFYKFSDTGETGKQIKQINDDVDILGFDINTSLERAVARSPSKTLKEILWGILAINRTGGDLVGFLREKSTNLMVEYRRKLSNISRQMSIYIELYLTMVILAAIFFTILTSIMSGISGGGSQGIITIQAFMIFVFIPAISIAFIFLLKTLIPSIG